MQWNIAPECTALVILSIIWIYSQRGSVLPTLKNRLFQCCFLATFIGIFSNILSTVLLLNYQITPLWISWIVTTIYYITTPLMGEVYFFYAAAVVYDGRKGVGRLIAWACIPGILYAIFVIVNPLTKSIFSITLENGYERGSAVIVTYIIFYAYCLACILLVLLKRDWVERQVFRILGVFPLVAVVVIVFQQQFSNIILSGSAATCALLIIYLHLQNKQIAIDYLTGLPNRKELLNMVNFMIKKEPDRPFAVMVFSLRDFKQINASYGQQNGDLFIKTISQYLCIAAQPHLVYRFNGDEFAVLFKDGEKDAINAVINVTQARMADPWDIKDCSCRISGVIGIARYPESSKNIETLINSIEYAVAKAKKENTLEPCYCDQKMFDEIQRKSDIIKILKEKCEDNSFEIYYQPIFNVEKNNFYSAESLMRINDTHIGPIYPSEFIPIAEETGIIVEITYKLLDRACKFINRLSDAGANVDNININLSAVQFNQRDMLERLYEIIKQNNTPFNKIKVEFTESALAENTEIVTKSAFEMRKKGLRLGLDDFGTGYSNMNSVLNIPFNTIKLDRSLIWAGVKNNRSNIMVTNLSNIFHEMGIQVLAEGVETEEHNEFVLLRDMELIQGFLYAKPMPENEAEKFLVEKIKLLQ